MQLVFDGHNDVLLRLWHNGKKGGDPVAEFVDGTAQGHIDVPRARAGGLAGGLCAVYIPSGDLILQEPDENGHYVTPLAAPLQRQPSLDIAMEKMAIAYRVERAGGWKICRSTADIRKANPGVEVIEVVGDITTVEGREAALKALGPIDILVNNAGGPPPGDFRNWTRDDWIKAVDANMLTPIELIKATVDGMMARKFGRIVNITSAAVKSPIEILGLSNGARAGLTGFIAGLSRKTVINNVTINGLLPGPFETDRLTGTAKAEADKRGTTPEQILTERAKLNPAGRFGQPDEFGAACAFLCSAHAGYITGQNLLIDGGVFPGAF